MRTPTATAIALIVFAAGAASAAELHVAPPDRGGDDGNPGTRERPFATLARACRAGLAAGVTVRLRGGTHYLGETLVLTPEDSGTADAPTTFEAEPGAEVVLSGGVRLDLAWEPHRGAIVKARVPRGLVTDQLFVNGEPQILARYPSLDPAVRILGGYARDAVAPERARRWADPRGGFLHAMHVHMWGDFHHAITGVDAEGNVTLEGGWQNNRRLGMHPEYRFVENILEELDAPGEWFLDPRAGTLYFWPPAGLDLPRATFEAVRLRHLVEIRGTRERPVRFVRFRGMTFRHACRTFMENREPLLRSDWTTYRGGAIFVSGAEDCAVEDCAIDGVGGNAIFASGYVRRLRIRGCRIADAGANGVAFVGDPRAVRSPLFEYGQRQRLADIEPEPGPRSPDHPDDCLVDDCLIYRTGRVEKQTAPVQISMASGIVVRHCSIYDVPRAGINIGDGCWGGHVIEGCDVFDTVKETGDHGSFNSWGRDRYWNLEGAPPSELPRLALLDTVRPIVLRNNRWRCDHGWDVDLDDGSSNYEIHDNLFLRGGLKLREGFHRKVWNNIAVNNTLHPHVWYDSSGDEVTRNIFMGAYLPAGGMPSGRWGKEVDLNLFTTSHEDRARFAMNGCDARSVVGDPLFVDPANGDYRVRDGSPALALGFRNFPMDRFGVRKPELRAVARSPEPPEVRIRPDLTPVPPPEPVLLLWRGAVVRSIGGEEYSAFGVSRDSGGVLVVDAPAGSLAGRDGFRANDLIREVDGRPVRDSDELARALADAPRAGTMRIGVVRGQAPAAVAVASPAETPARIAAQRTDGSIVLSAALAEMHGGVRLEGAAGKPNVGYWDSADDWVSFRIRVDRPGRFFVSAVTASPNGDIPFVVACERAEVRGTAPRTGSYGEYREVDVGELRIAEAGAFELTVRPADSATWKAINLRAVALRAP